MKETPEIIDSDKLKAALAEYDEMKNNPTSYKRYQSFDALVAEVLEDISSDCSFNEE